MGDAGDKRRLLAGVFLGALGYALVGTVTDRIKALTVILDQDYRDDDVQAIVHAIEQLRGVSSVTLVQATTDDYMARQVVGLKIERVIFDALRAYVKQE